MICCCLNSAISLGTLRLGLTFSSGIFLTYIIFIIIGFLYYYSLKLLVLSATVFHESAFIEIWRVAFSNITIFFPIVITILSSIADMVEYVREIQTSFIAIYSKVLNLLSKNDKELVGDLESHEMLIGITVFVLFLLPICMTKRLNTMAILSYIAVYSILIFTLYIIGIFIYHTKNYGFNPDDSLKLFHFKFDVFIKSLASAIFSFNFYPLTYPGIRHVCDSTKTNLMHIFLITTIIIFFDYIIIGTFSYLTFFDKNTYGTVFDYFPENKISEKFLLIFGRIITLIFVLLTIPFRINSCRYIILNLISPNASFPTDIWIFVGIIISLITVCFANLSYNIINIFYIISDIIASLLMFVFTPLFYLKGFGRQNLLNFFMSIFMIVFGIASAVLIPIYDEFY